MHVDVGRLPSHSYIPSLKNRLEGLKRTEKKRCLDCDFILQDEKGDENRVMAALTVHNKVTKNIYKVVRFDCSVDWEEERRRTARGFQLRRERKERKQTGDHNRENKIEATVDIIMHQQRRSKSLVTLARRDRHVMASSTLFWTISMCPRTMPLLRV